MKTRLREIRISKKLTQKNLGDILGVDSRTISTWETGTRTPPPSKMQQIEDYFEVDKENIFFEAFSYKT